MAPGSNCNGSNEMYNNGQLGDQQLTAYGVDDYCQDLDNLVFCLDDFFVPGAGQQENEVKKSNQEQHKILTGLLVSEILNDVNKRKVRVHRIKTQGGPNMSRSRSRSSIQIWV